MIIVVVVVVAVNVARFNVVPYSQRNASHRNVTQTFKRMDRAKILLIVDRKS